MGEFTSRTELNANLQAQKAALRIDELTGYEKFLADVIGFDETGKDTEWGKTRAFISNLFMGVPGDKVADMYKNEIMTNKTDDVGKVWRSNEVQGVVEDINMAQFTSEIEGGKVFATFASMGSSMGGGGAGGAEGAMGGAGGVSMDAASLGSAIGSQGFSSGQMAQATGQVAQGVGGIDYGSGPLTSATGGEAAMGGGASKGGGIMESFGLSDSEGNIDYGSLVDKASGIVDGFSTTSKGNPESANMGEIEDSAERKYRDDMKEIQGGYETMDYVGQIPIVGNMAYSIFNENALRDRLDAEIDYGLGQIDRMLVLDESEFRG